MDMNGIDPNAAADMGSHDDGHIGASRCVKRKRPCIDVGPDGSYIQYRKRSKHEDTAADKSRPGRRTSRETKSNKLRSLRTASRTSQLQSAEKIQTCSPKSSEHHVALDSPVSLTASQTASTPPTRTSPPPQSAWEPRCGHVRHPAHSQQHAASLCPACRLGYLVSCLRAVSLRIMNQGGLHQWLERSGGPSVDGQREGSYGDWEASTRGGCARNRKYIFRDEYGNDISHRHCKQRLHTLLLELEVLAEKEAAWEAEIGVADHELDATIENCREHSASTALEKFRNLEGTGFLTQVEQTCATFMRERGRDLEIATDAEYPPNLSESALTHKFNKKTQAQVQFILESRVPAAVEADGPYATIDTAPKRKPRRKGRKVTFSEDVKVCAHSDIDEFRRYACVAASLEPDPRATRSNIYTEPKMRCVTRATRPANTPVRHHNAFCRGKSDAYTPGPWAMQDGSVVINTCGVKDIEQRESYYQMLQWQAEHADGDDEDVRDQEMFLAFLRGSGAVNRVGGGLLVARGTGIVGFDYPAVRREWEKMSRGYGM